jgi:hypothetical protein
MLVYIVREAGKTGGQRFERRQSAIEAAVLWYCDTGKVCNVYCEIEDRTASDEIGEAILNIADKPLVVGRDQCGDACFLG